jgi:hypothetical protein
VDLPLCRRIQLSVQSFLRDQESRVAGSQDPLRFLRFQQTLLTCLRRRVYTAAQILEWCIRQKSGWRRFRESVEQVAWTRSEVVQTLHAVEFRRIRAYDAAAFFRGDPRIAPDAGTFLAAKG